MGYYHINSDTYYTQSQEWAEERESLQAQGCRLLEVNEANRFELVKIFSKSDNDDKPTLNLPFNFFILPYELVDKLPNEMTADDVIIDLVLENLNTPFYYASTDSDKCCVIECQTLDIEILYTPYHIHINTPFILFDDTMEFFVLVDYDLPFQAVGYKNTINDSHGYIANQLGQAGWNSVLTRYRSYTNMPSFFDKYYKNILPKEFRKLLNEKLNASNLV